jgi:hypothetical protein
MANKPIPNPNSNQAAAELIEQNVSFDFRSYLSKIDPAPSHVVPMHRSDRRSGSEPELPRMNHVRESLSK